MKDSIDYSNITEKIGDMIGSPKDVILGFPIISMIGNTELCIENYRGLIEYTSSFIRITTKTGMLKIDGLDLVIDSYDQFEMHIVGVIKQIEFI